MTNSIKTLVDARTYAVRFIVAFATMGITNVQVVAAGAGKSLYNSRTLTTRQRQLNRSAVATLSYK